jgi:hypothetical protein
VTLNVAFWPLWMDSFLGWVVMDGAVQAGITVTTAVALSACPQSLLTRAQ